MKLLWAFVLAFALLYGVVPLRGGDEVHADPPPPEPTQKYADIFSCGVQLCDVYDPLVNQIQTTGHFTYSVVITPGCDNGYYQRFRDHITYTLLDAAQVGVFATEVPTGGDLVLRYSCGSTFSATCGATAAACLGEGFPYNVNITFDNRIGTYYLESLVSIILHELLGHAAAAWNEQYCQAADAECPYRFSPVPGQWYDFMNTGAQSRFLFTAITIARWGRTMGVPAPERWGYDGWTLTWCNDDLPSHDRLESAVAVMAYDWVTGGYRYTGLHFADNGQSCQGAWGIPYWGNIGPTEIVCFDRGNAVDWQHPLLRSDRCAF